MTSNIRDFHVGDEVMREGHPEKFIVTFVSKAEKIICGFGAGGATFMDAMPTTYYPTGKVYTEIAGLLEQLAPDEEARVKNTDDNEEE